MDRVVQTHHFGPHRVDLIEQAGDEETAYLVLVDGAVATPVPLPVPPDFETVVRIYARSRPAVAAGAGPDRGRKS